MTHDDEGGATGAPVGKAKACKILEDGQVQGVPLTPAQKRLFGMVCAGEQPALGGMAQGGVVTHPQRWQEPMLEVLCERPDFQDVLASLGDD